MQSTIQGVSCPGKWNRTKEYVVRCQIGISVEASIHISPKPHYITLQWYSNKCTCKWEAIVFYSQQRPYGKFSIDFMLKKREEKPFYFNPSFPFTFLFCCMCKDNRNPKQSSELSSSSFKTQDFPFVMLLKLFVGVTKVGLYKTWGSLHFWHRLMSLGFQTIL